MQMPEPDRAVIAPPRARSPPPFARLLPADGVIEHEDARRAYESDGLTAYRQTPAAGGAAARPRRRSPPSCAIATSRASRWCRAAPAPRSRGGALPLADGILLGMAQVQPHPRDRSRKPLRRGAAGRHQPRHHPRGAAAGFYYAPDPSSQIACTIGGNVAENSGGVHCLKYGLTTNNVLGVEMVLIDGRGGPPRRQASRCRRL